MGCCVSCFDEGFPREGLHLYNRDGQLLYTLIYSYTDWYLLLNSGNHDVVKLRFVKPFTFNNNHIVIDCWVTPKWWNDLASLNIFNEMERNDISNNFIVRGHYFRLELSNLSLTKMHKKLGIKYLVNIGTYNRYGEIVVFDEVMYGMI
jgi:hypothetical protein